MNIKPLHSIITTLLFFFISVISTPHVFAQISEGGTPISFKDTHQSRFKSALPTQVLRPFNLQKVIAEDKAKGRDFRFAAPIAVDFNMKNSGRWTDLDNGDRVWQLKVQSKGAISLAVLYDEFYLPKGAKLYMYSADKQQVLGAYTHQNNKKSRRFMTGLIKGETAIIEYYEPAAVKGQGAIRIFSIQHAYDRERITRDNVFPKVYSGFSFGDALDCHINVNCPQGDDWQREKRGVVRILLVVEEGMGWCTGSLINNVNNDGKPFVLTAFHCQDGYTPLYDMYRFDFNFEAFGCTSPTQEPEFQSILGCYEVSGRVETDFSLFELSLDVPNSYNPYFNGWDRTPTYEPPSTVNIHHPIGDLKKISLDYDQAVIHPNGINWNTTVSTPPNHHYRVYYEEGTFEPGSSGSPLFDPNGLIVGQLNGGNANCNEFEAFFGRFSISWDGGNHSGERLKDWLDPDDTGVMSVLPYDPNANIGGHSVSGTIAMNTGTLIENATIYLYDTAPDANTTPIDSTLSDANGAYTFEDLADGSDYYVSVKRAESSTNGVSTFDIVKIQEHILGSTQFTTVYERIAADVNADGNITTFDAIKTRQVILFAIPAFDDVPNWVFLNPDYSFSDPVAPSDNYNVLEAEYVKIESISEDQMTVDFIALKMGDVSFDASGDE